MKIRTTEFSEEAHSEAFSLTALAWFMVQVLGVGYAGVKLAAWLNANDGQTLAVVLVMVVGYLAYAVAKMASVDVDGARAIAEEAEARALAVEAEAEKSERYGQLLQALNEKAQTLSEEKRLLSEKVRTLGQDLGNALARASEAERSLKEELAHAPAKQQRAIESALAEASERYTQALSRAEMAVKQAKSEANEWQSKYNALRREADEANAQKEVQALTATVRNRMAAMKGRAWGDDLKAKHLSELDRLRGFGVEVTDWEIA